MDFDPLDLAIDTAEDSLANEQSIRPVFRQAVFHRMLDEPWPDVARMLITVRTQKLYAAYGEFWQMLDAFDVDHDFAFQMIRVYEALIDMQLDPDRYGDVPVEQIDENLGKIRMLTRREDRSVFIQNLRAPVEVPE